MQPELITEGSYVRVFGNLKSFQGNPHIIISRISKVKDPNDITTHLLETTYTFLKMTKVAAVTYSYIILVFDSNKSWQKQFLSILDCRMSITC